VAVAQGGGHHHPVAQGVVARHGLPHHGEPEIHRHLERQVGGPGRAGGGLEAVREALPERLALVVGQAAGELPAEQRRERLRVGLAQGDQGHEVLDRARRVLGREGRLLGAAGLAQQLGQAEDRRGIRGLPARRLEQGRGRAVAPQQHQVAAGRGQRVGARPAVGEGALRRAQRGVRTLAGRQGHEPQGGARVRGLHPVEQGLHVGEALGPHVGDEQVVGQAEALQVVLERLVLRDGGGEVRARGVAVAMGIVLQEDGQVAARFLVLRVELLGLAVGGDGAGPVIALGEAPPEVVVLADPAEGDPGVGQAGLQLDRLLGLLARGLAQPAGEEGAGDARARQRLLRRQGGQAPELVQGLPHPAGGQQGLAGLVESDHHRLLFGELPHAVAQGRELGRAEPPLAAVEAQRGRDHAVRAGGVGLLQRRRAELPRAVGRQRPRREAGRRHDAVALLELERPGEDVVVLARLRSPAVLFLVFVLGRGGELLGQPFREGGEEDGHGRVAHVGRPAAGVRRLQAQAEGVRQVLRIGEVEVGQLLGEIGLTDVVLEGFAQLLAVGVGIGRAQLLLLGAPVLGGLDHAGAAQVGEVDLPCLDLAIVGRGGLGSAHEAGGGRARHQRQASLVLHRQLAGPRERVGGIDPHRRAARHHDDGMVEGAHPRQGLLDVRVPFAGVEQRHVGRDVEGAEQGGEQHRLVLAVAELPLQGLGRRAGHQAAVAELDAGVADLAAHPRQQGVDGLELRAGRAAGRAQKRREVRAADRPVHDRRVPLRQVAPRPAGRESDVGRARHLGREPGFGLLVARQVAGLEREAAPAAGGLLGGRDPGELAGGPAQRQALGSLQHEAGAAHRHGHLEGHELHGAAVEERGGLADAHLLLDDRARSGGRQRRAQHPAVLEHVGRARRLGALREGGGIEPVLGAVRRDHAGAEAGPLLVPGRPALLDGRPALVGGALREAVDQALRVGLPAGLVVGVDRLHEEHVDAAVARALEGRGGADERGRIGGEGRPVPGLGGRARGRCVGRHCGEQRGGGERRELAERDGTGGGKQRVRHDVSSGATRGWRADWTQSSYHAGPVYNVRAGPIRSVGNEVAPWPGVPAARSLRRTSALFRRTSFSESYDMSLRSISLRAAMPAIAVLAGALAAAPLAATSYVMVSDEALVDGSPVAAVVRVISEDRAAGLRGGGNTPATEYVVQVEAALKGQINGTVAIRVPGGDARGGMALKIEGAPRFETNERALLFLEPVAGGAWRVMHLLLGAFHEVDAGGHRLAVRDLGEARELRPTESGVEAAPGQDRLRDFDAFTRWVADRAGRVNRSADYYVMEDVEEGGLGKITSRFRLFEDPQDGYNLRWFNFDNSGSVPWKAYKKGQTGLSGGGYAQFQAALKDWNNEPETPIDYRYNGTTSVKNGLVTYDEVNAVLFNDPNNELPSFSCSSGGVLAYGGPWYYNETTNYLGKPHHAIANADVVINDGLSCFFANSPNGAKAAEELFGHELGHTLGLNHSCGDSGSSDPNCTNPVYSDALMRAYVHDDSRGGRLNSDDQTAVRILYKIGGYSLAPAAPTELTADPQSTTEVRLAWKDKATDETGYKVEREELTGDFEEVLSLPANTTSAVVGGLASATGYAFRVRAFNAAGPSAYSNVATTSTNAPVGPCVADGQTLCLTGDRFRVQVEWETSGGDTGLASVVPVSADNSGLFWFFAPDNWEMLVKVLDACAATDPHYWVFFAATTNVQFTVTVTDTQTGRVKTYVNPQGTSADAVTDTNAFATCP
jgi:hypothetical protein